MLARNIRLKLLECAHSLVDNTGAVEGVLSNGFYYSFPSLKEKNHDEP